ncbi:MAG TPA: hypothetical protein PKV84_05960 [Candidatus Omnitrophota bacterium]|nr:hypothetical protein [Candidatus Omnitrophota bacterium]
MSKEYELDKRIFDFGMDCLEGAFCGKFNRTAYWREVKEMGSFEFMRGIEFVVKTVTFGDGLIPYKIRKGGRLKTCAFCKGLTEGKG